VRDDAKARNNGTRIYAARPLVARDTGVAILGIDGKADRPFTEDEVSGASDPEARTLIVFPGQ
jgi:hypothetical protein